MRGFGVDLIRVDGHDTVGLRQALKRKTRRVAVIFATTTAAQFPFLNGLSAHYYRMNEEDYRQAKESLA